jgi:hypothetical protein
MRPDPLPGLVRVDAAALRRVRRAFTAQQRAQQRLQAAMVALHEATRAAEREFVDDELALVMTCHPATADRALAQALLASAFPALLQEWAAGHLTDRHVHAAVEELHDCLGEQHQRIAVLDRVLDRCRRRAADGQGWPTPGTLRRMIQVAALLVDPDGAQQRKQAADQQRGVHASALPDGQAMLALEGPQERIAVLVEAIRARAAQAARAPGETRSREQLEFDLAEALLLGGTLTDPDHEDVDDDGTDGEGGGNGEGRGDREGRGDGDGERGGHAQDPVRFDVQVVMSHGTATADTDESGELPGFGPILPSTCRELLARASTLTRICTDPLTGRVLAVDDPIRVDRDPDAITTALAAMRTAPLVLPELGTDRYRPTAKALRFVQTRDRTCRFPGCTRPARFSDVDHELPWPRGSTDPRNLHCLCRHHHRAKQSGLFTVHTDPDGSTAWTITATNTVYRRPPPTILPTL